MEENRRNKFLDKVVDFLVKDTKVNYDNRTLFFPFTLKKSLRQGSNNLTNFHKLLFDTYIPIDGFVEYIEEMYGINLTEDIVYVWESYKVIMYNIVFGNSATPLYFNESDDRRNKFLDKVVDFLVKDTKVDYEDRELFFPFTLKKSLRQNTDNSTSFHKILFHKDSIIPLDGFMEYIEEMYGITDIKDVSYVWGKYKDVMRYNVFGNDPTNEPIYESEDKEKKLLDRILKYLMNDTIVDHRTGEITFPFFLQVLPPMPRKFFDFRSTSNYNFSDYCKKTYGLNDDEVVYLWPKYKELFSDEVFGRNSINESEDKRKGYLNKIIVLLVTGTIIDWGEERVRFPYLPEYNFSFSQYPFTTLGKVPTHLFTEYCKEQYGLTEDEVEYVWKFYVDAILGEYNNKSKLSDSSFMNESDDKKQKYLDKILKWFVDDTIIRYETGVIIYPFSQIGPNGKPLPSFIDDLKNKLSWGMSSDIQITCRDTYGLNYDETKYIWDNYKKIIKDRYNKESIMYDLKPINESDDKKQVYLDKIVDWLVRDTEVGGYWFNPPYYYPGSSAGRTGFRSVYEHTFGLLKNTAYSGLDSQLIYFDHYCKNNYGLTGEEANIVWHQYMKKLKESYDWGF